MAEKGLLSPKLVCLLWRGPAPTGRQKMESNLVSAISEQMLGTIRINGLEMQVRAIQKLLITSKTTLYGGKG